MPLIIATTGDEARDYARRLLDAADHPADIQTQTLVGDGVVGFEVPAELARAAGFDPGDESDDDEPVKPEAPARNGSRALWAAWLDNQPEPITYDGDASRDDLIALWDAHTTK